MMIKKFRQRRVIQLYRKMGLSNFFLKDLANEFFFLTQNDPKTHEIIFFNTKNPGKMTLKKVTDSQPHQMAPVGPKIIFLPIISPNGDLSTLF